MTARSKGRAPRRDRHAPSPLPYALLGLVWLAGSVLIVGGAVHQWRAANPAGPVGVTLTLLLAVVALAESVALFYLLGFLTKSLAYIGMRLECGVVPPASSTGATATRSVAVLYLTAGDFDPVAVDSLLRLEGPGPLLFVLHDDGSDELARDRMREFVEQHPERRRWQIEIWHRPERKGGKAGAVNWVLERLDRSWDLLLLCDSDSIALDPTALSRSVTEFDDSSVAVVQFRNVGYAGPDEPLFQRRLVRAVDVFDAFAAPQAVWGYLPFFGHNALVRVEALRRHGGLTPGFFSDDLDFSVRLTLAGERIRYRRDVVFAERHPPDWVGFRKRARKWAFGCMQVVRARTRDVLTRRGVPFAHRVGLLEFMGFYPAQALLAAGLLARHLVLPWLTPPSAAGSGYAAMGWIVLAALFGPTLAWSLRERRLRQWPALAWSCALVYGGSLLATARGVLDGLSRRERPWIPTNLSERRAIVPAAGWYEAVLGAGLVAVPWFFEDRVLLSPATYLFVATYLFAPLTFAAYREAAAERATVSERRGLERRLGSVLPILLMVCVIFAGRARAAEPEWTTSGTQLLHEGKPFQVRGIYYGPWLPGTGPDGHSPYPAAALVRKDLHSIRSLGANTILVTGAPGWVVRQAQREGMGTLYAFSISWVDTSLGAFQRQSESVLAGVDSLRATPGLIAWLLGNEVPPWVVQQLGPHEVERRLRELATRVRTRDPRHLIGHENWPPAKDLDLSFLDLACFNLYPAWPYEVAVRGFGPYLREVLVPVARGRPLLISEFGINTLEASEARQARVIADCWHEIAASPTVGGVVFEWSDEWWKNFDNPIPGKSYWERSYAPDDARSHDQDPEEYYGLVQANRKPRPAVEAVRAMWRRPAGRSILPWLILAGLAILTAIVFGLTRGRRGQRTEV